jgi:signal transduction histidine kinase
VSFWIRDPGPGIAQEQHERIFDRFVRGPASPKGEGAGLGLAIVRGIAEAHQGRVEVDSSPGRGAIFRVVLPVGRPAAQPVLTGRA